MTIEQLEAEIKRVGSLLATAELQYAQSGCFSEAGRVSGYALEMRRLVDALEQKVVSQ